MKKCFFFFLCAMFLLSCNNAKVESTSSSSADSTAKSSVDLPYKASYTSNFTTDVSDADLKMVLMTYKDWENGNITGLGSAMGDTVTVDMSSGDHLKKTNADLMKMYAPDKKDGYVVTWYDETDTYKNGKVDSASYHDINQVKDGKIIWYAQYKRPKK